MGILVAAVPDIRAAITDPCWVSRFWSVFLSVFFCGNVTPLFKPPLVLLYIIMNCACVRTCFAFETFSLILSSTSGATGFVL